jgi:hypothetical protein
MLYQNIAGQSLLGRDQWRWRVDRVDGEIVWMVELVSLETTIPLGLLHTASSKEIWSRGMMPPMPKWYHCPSPVGDIGNLKFEGGVARRHCNHRIGIYMPGEWVRRKEGEGRGREGEREREHLEDCEMDDGGGGCRENCIENSHPPSWFAEGQEISVRRQLYIYIYEALIQHDGWQGKNFSWRAAWQERICHPMEVPREGRDTLPREDMSNEGDEGVSWTGQHKGV